MNPFMPGVQPSEITLNLALMIAGVQAIVIRVLPTLLERSLVMSCASVVMKLLAVRALGSVDEEDVEPVSPWRSLVMSCARVLVKPLDDVVLPVEPSTRSLATICARLSWLLLA